MVFVNCCCFGLQLECFDISCDCVFGCFLVVLCFGGFCCFLYFVNICYAFVVLWYSLIFGIW